MVYLALLLLCLRGALPRTAGKRSARASQAAFTELSPATIACVYKLLSSEVMFVWSAAPISGRDEWKYSLLDHGALSLTLTGPVKTRRLSVAPWDTSDLVRFTATIKGCASTREATKHHFHC